MLCLAAVCVSRWLRVQCPFTKPATVFITLQLYSQRAYMLFALRPHGAWELGCSALLPAACRCFLLLLPLLLPLPSLPPLALIG